MGLSIVLSISDVRLRTLADTMHTRPACLTEVFQPPAPILERHQRLHRHLPTSSYAYGSIYSPLDIVPSFAVAGKDGEPDLKLSVLLLLEDDLQWRFGGQSEHAHSPPWSWTSEELCGRPSPYYARDLNHLSTLKATSPSPHHCSYLTALSTRPPPTHHIDALSCPGTY